MHRVVGRCLTSLVHRSTPRSKKDLVVHLTFATSSGLLWFQSRHNSAATRLEESKKDSADSEEDFDITEEWKSNRKDYKPSDFFDKILTLDPSAAAPTNQKQSKMSEDGKPSSGFQNMVGNFIKTISGSGDKETISDIVSKARERSGEGDVEDTTSVDDIFQMLDKYKDEIKHVADKYGENIDFSKLSPANVMYYLEREDERKNPSWKRRVHRFCPGIDITRVEELNAHFDMAFLSYADTVDEIRESLENNKTPYELAFATVKSSPGEPASFVAVKRDQPTGWGAPLEILLAVRGTKSLADAITDILCDSAEYRGGKVHSLIKESGMYLVEKHSSLFEELCEKAGKSKIKLTVVGHSLGAGAASVAGMEFNDNKKYTVEVIGFGCPALLSKDLAEKSSFITTVINDSDLVPRMSGVTVANLLLDIIDFDWPSYARRDVSHALDELQRFQPMILNKDIRGKVDETVEQLMQQFLKEEEKTKIERLEPELFPPGKCVHFYRDGSGISGCFVPNTFFNELDLTRRMVDDHVSHSGYQQTLLEIMRQQKGDHHFRFDSETEVSS